MIEDKDDLPSDQEDGALKPRKPRDSEPPAPPPDDKTADKDPSEQPS